MVAAMSYVSPKLVAAVRGLGFETVETKPVNGLSGNPEASHADMQILVLPEGDVFLLKGNDILPSDIRRRLTESGRRIAFTRDAPDGFSYPGCVKLNVAVVGRAALGNFKYADKKLTERLEALGYILVNVRQGYAKCAAAVVSDSAIITSDEGIASAAESAGIDVLRITPGHISLCSRYGGFIGGSCFLADESVLAFTGNVLTHPDGERIVSFCRSRGVEALSLTDSPLLDIGGIVRIL